MFLVGMVGMGEEQGEFFESFEFLLGGFVGPSIGWRLIDLDEVNSILEANGYASLGDRLSTYGARQVYSYPPHSDLFFGMDIWMGELRSELGDKRAELLISSFGLWDIALVAFQAQAEQIRLSAGFTSGLGAVELELWEGTSEDLEDAIENGFQMAFGYFYFAMEPNVSLHLRPLKWLAMQLRAGYLFTAPFFWQEREWSILRPAFKPDGLSVGGSVQINLGILFEPWLQELADWFSSLEPSEPDF